MNAEEIKGIISLILLAGDAGAELYLKLKAIGELGPDEQANIHKLIADGINFDQAMKDRYAQWRRDVGLDSSRPQLQEQVDGLAQKLNTARGELLSKRV